jgi:hypothetical protein
VLYTVRILQILLGFVSSAASTITLFLVGKLLVALSASVLALNFTSYENNCIFVHAIPKALILPQRDQLEQCAISDIARGTRYHLFLRHSLISTDYTVS